VVLSCASRIAIAAALGLCAGWGTSGCGSGVMPGTGFDTALFSFQASVIPAGALPPDAHPLVGLIWSDPLQGKPDVVMPAQWISATPGDAAWTELTVRIFRPPPPAALIDITSSGGDHAQMALGELVIVDDDGDGTFRISGPRAEIAQADGAGAGSAKKSDSYLAGAFQPLVYVARPFRSSTLAFPVFPPGQVGYHLVDYGCDGRLSRGPNVPKTTSFQMQPSRFLPELRNCMRSHSP